MQSIDGMQQAELMFFPPTQQAQNTELALFLMGMFQTNIEIGFDTLKSILADLVADVPED